MLVGRPLVKAVRLALGGSSCLLFVRSQEEWVEYEGNCTSHKNTAVAGLAYFEVTRDLLPGMWPKDPASALKSYRLRHTSALPGLLTHSISMREGNN